MERTHLCSRGCCVANHKDGDNVASTTRVEEDFAFISTTAKAPYIEGEKGNCLAYTATQNGVRWADCSGIESDPDNFITTAALNTLLVSDDCSGIFPTFAAYLRESGDLANMVNYGPDVNPAVFDQTCSIKGSKDANVLGEAIAVQKDFFFKQQHFMSVYKNSGDANKFWQAVLKQDHLDSELCLSTPAEGQKLQWRTCGDDSNVELCTRYDQTVYICKTNFAIRFSKHCDAVYAKDFTRELSVLDRSMTSPPTGAPTASPTTNPTWSPTELPTPSPTYMELVTAAPTTAKQTVLLEPSSELLAGEAPVHVKTDPLASLPILIGAGISICALCILCLVLVVLRRRKEEPKHEAPLLPRVLHKRTNTTITIPDEEFSTSSRAHGSSISRIDFVSAQRHQRNLKRAKSLDSKSPSSVPARGPARPLRRHLSPVHATMMHHVSASQRASQLQPVHSQAFSGSVYDTHADTCDSDSSHFNCRPSLLSDGRSVALISPNGGSTASRRATGGSSLLRPSNVEEMLKKAMDRPSFMEFEKTHKDLFAPSKRAEQKPDESDNEELLKHTHTDELVELMGKINDTNQILRRLTEDRDQVVLPGCTKTSSGSLYDDDTLRSRPTKHSSHGTVPASLPASSRASSKSLFETPEDSKLSALLMKIEEGKKTWCGQDGGRATIRDLEVEARADTLLDNNFEMDRASAEDREAAWNKVYDDRMKQARESESVVVVEKAAKIFGVCPTITPQLSKLLSTESHTSELASCSFGDEYLPPRSVAMGVAESFESSQEKLELQMPSFSAAGLASSADRLPVVNPVSHRQHSAPM